jgi:hypothetical protein
MTGLVVVRAYAIGLTSPAKPLFALTAALHACVSPTGREEFLGLHKEIKRASGSPASVTQRC